MAAAFPTEFLSTPPPHVTGEPQVGQNPNSHLSLHLFTPLPLLINNQRLHSFLLVHFSSVLFIPDEPSEAPQVFWFEVCVRCECA